MEANSARTMSIPSAAIYMLGYEKLLSHISPMFTSDTSAHASSLHRKIDANTSVMQVLTPAPLVAGSLARTISATVISPIEMFRIRLQALPRGRSFLCNIYLGCHTDQHSQSGVPVVCFDTERLASTGQYQRCDYPLAGSGTYTVARCAFLW